MARAPSGQCVPPPPAPQHLLAAAVRWGIRDLENSPCLPLQLLGEPAWAGTPQLSLEKENKMSQWLLNGRAAEPASRSGCMGCWLLQRWGRPTPGPSPPDVKRCAGWPRQFP